MSDRRKTTSRAQDRRKRNRRASPRWVLDFEVRLQWENQSATCRGYEIGAGGLSLTCEKPLPTKAEITVEYRLDSDSPLVSVKGTVRHVEGSRVGIEFLNLGMKDRLALLDYCEKLNIV